MLSPASARRVEIWPTMFGTLLFAIAMRAVEGTRGSAASGKFTGGGCCRSRGSHAACRRPSRRSSPRPRSSRRRGAAARRHPGPFELPPKEVADIRRQLARLQRGEDRRFVHDRRPREIQHGAAVRHQGYALCVDESARRVCQRHVNGHGVRPREEIIEAQGLLDAGRKLPGSLDRDLRVVAQHVHAEQVRGIGDLHADCAEPDDAERAPRQLVADEALLALLHRGLEGIA